MHPEPAFAMPHKAMVAFVRDVAFAHIFVHGPAGAGVIHAPVTLDAAGDLVFHVARRNRAVALLDGARGIASIGGPGAYVSPDWYAAADQVPTWNYVAVEVEGAIQPVDRETLLAQLDALAAAHEPRLAPKPVWTRAKMDPARVEAMARAITGHVLRAEQWRGTAKLGQNKPAADLRGVVAGLRAAGHADIAARTAAHLAAPASRA